MICVVATSPTVDTYIVCGPYRSNSAAEKAREALTSKGYNAEVCQMVNVSEVDTSGAWDEGET